MSTSCPALLLSAPASGQGKTTVTAGLARYHRNQGRKVRIFKTGPDFLDPMILERASGLPVYQLDLWMVGERDCKTCLLYTSQACRIGRAMGFDGKWCIHPNQVEIVNQTFVPSEKDIQLSLIHI